MTSTEANDFQGSTSKEILKIEYRIHANFKVSLIFFTPDSCDEGADVCSVLITLCSVFMVLVTLPVSLLFTIKV